jgi:hypothetical protein
MHAVSFLHCLLDVINLEEYVSLHATFFRVQLHRHIWIVAAAQSHVHVHEEILQVSHSACA